MNGLYICFNFIQERIGSRTADRENERRPEGRRGWPGSGDVPHSEKPHSVVQNARGSGLASPAQPGPVRLWRSNLAKCGVRIFSAVELHCICVVTWRGGNAQLGQVTGWRSKGPNDLEHLNKKDQTKSLELIDRDKRLSILPTDCALFKLSATQGGSLHNHGHRQRKSMFR
jgi:hypothetical protein